jgi:hypothetical protein
MGLLLVMGRLVGLGLMELGLAEVVGRYRVELLVVAVEEHWVVGLRCCCQRLDCRALRIRDLDPWRLMVMDWSMVLMIEGC